MLTMLDSTVTDAVSATTGLILLSASIRLLHVQGVALAALVIVIGLSERSVELLAAGLLVLAVKGLALPWALTRTARATGVVREPRPLLNPTAGVLAATGLTTLAFVVSRPVAALDPARHARAVPVGTALVLIGFLVLLSHRTAMSQLIGFVVLDNGIATVAFLTAGGLPLVIDLGATLDVVLVVLILRVFTARMRLTHGGTDLDDLTELHD